MFGEKFLPIKNFEGYYQVSNEGRVKSLQRKNVLKDRILKPVLIGPKCKKYLAVNLYKDEKMKTYKIHQLVMNAFKPNPNPEVYTEIDHIRGGNIFCNSVNDLEWVTHSENIKRSFTRDGRKHPMLGKFGKDNPKSIPILKIDKITRKVLAEYNSMIEAKRITGIADSDICNCCKRKAKTAGGFIWRYK